MKGRLSEPVTQNERVLEFLRSNPGCTALDIAHGCHPWVSNPRARISDLRAKGYVIECVGGHYVVREPVAVTTGTQEVLSL